MMDEYRKQLKKRLVVSGILMGAMILFVATAGTIWYRMSLTSQEHLSDFMHGVPTGMAPAFGVLGVVYYIKVLMALKNEDKLRALYIKEHDERTLMIESKSFSLGFGITLYALVLGTMVAAFFNTVVALTLFCVIAFMAFLKLGLRLWYSKKY